MYVVIEATQSDAMSLVCLSPVKGAVSGTECLHPCRTPERTPPGDPGSSWLWTQPVVAGEGNP